jgi:hypothetical protein
MSEEIAYDSQGDVQKVHSKPDPWKQTGKFFFRHYVLLLVLVVIHNFGFLFL